MLCTRQYCKIINLFTFKVAELSFVQTQNTNSGLKDLLANVCDTGFSLAQGIT